MNLPLDDNNKVTSSLHKFPKESTISSLLLNIQEDLRLRLHTESAVECSSMNESKENRLSVSKKHAYF